MPYTQIPGLNFSIRQSLDRLSYQHLIYNQEFVERMLLIMGHPNYFTNTTYGVVAPTDPRASIAGDTNALTVSVNSSDALSIDINPGMAVTLSGMWLVLKDYVRNISLADTTIGSTNVIYLRYLTLQSQKEVNDYKDPVVAYTMRPGGIDVNGINAIGDSVYVVVDTVSSYLSLPSDARSNTVALAVATMQTSIDPDTGITTSVMSIDHTNVSYSWNRPWFSAQDTEHRAKLGTGTQTDENTHALSYTDLSVGNFSLPQLLLDHGMIIAEDKSIPKQPGSSCMVAIPPGPTNVKTDVTGEYTGFIGKKYAELPNYPTRLGKVWIEGTNEELAALLVEGTNRIVFPADDPPDKNIDVYYTKVDACEPPIGVNNTEFATKNPVEQELIVAGGSFHGMLASTVLDFSNAQKFPMLYDVLVGVDGELVKTPQVVYCYKTLDSISSTDTLSIAQYGPGKIMIGLADASGAATMSVKITIEGKTAEADSYLTETFTFDSSWVNPGPVPNPTVPSNTAVKVSTNVFGTIDLITIDERVDDGPNSAIMLWVALNPTDTQEKLKDACHVAHLLWDGVRIHSILDKRIIGTTLRDFLQNSDAAYTLEYIARSIAGGSATVYSEDFRCPRYHPQVLNSNYDVTLEQTLPANNLGKLRVGTFGWYHTRALPVMFGSGVVWRVVLLPAQQARSLVYYGGNVPIFDYYDGAWAALPMVAVPGLPGTFQVTLPNVPTRVRVHVDANESISMLIFG